MRSLSLSFAAGTLASLLFAGAAHAAIVVHTTQASFLAASTAVGVDTYDDLPGGALPAALDRTAGAHAYRAEVSGNVDQSFYTAGGPSDRWLSTLTNTDVVTFGGFAPSVAAIGAFFFASDFDGGATGDTQLTVSVTDADGTVTQVLTNATPGTFLGFTSTGAIQSLVLRTASLAGCSTFNVGPCRWNTVDDLHLGQTVPVPVPATLGLALAALALLPLGRRRAA